MEQQKNKNIPLIVIVIVTLLVISGGGAYAFFANQNKVAEVDSLKKNDSMMKDDAMVSPTDAMMKDETTPTPQESMNNDKIMKAGLYTDYDPSILANAKEGKVILFFKASWCPTCQGVDKNITSNIGNIPSDVSLLKVDYDKSTDLKKKYGVTYQHTFVQVDENGNQIKKWSSSPTLNDILKEI